MLNVPSQKKARQIICVNNLLQLFLAFEQYTNDNNGLLPRRNNSGTSKDGAKICNAEVWFKDGAANNYEGYYGSIAHRHSKAANILFIDRHVERIQNGNTDGARNEGRPNGQDGS